MKKKVIIIGGGAAGMSALWALHDVCDVTLIERESNIGGHAYTYEYDINGGKIPVDMGVEYIHERLSPNLFELLKLLKIDTYVAPFSFCAFTRDNGEKHFWSNTRLSGTLNSKHYLEMERFQNELQALVINGADSFRKMSIGEFVSDKGFSKAFIHEVLLPVLTTFSGCRAPSLTYSLMYVALSFNMNLLSFFNACHWRKIEGGVKNYLKELYKSLHEHIKLDQKIRQIKRRNNLTVVEIQNGQQYICDHLIFACSAERILEILPEMAKPQRKILKRFAYVDVSSTVHTDQQAIHFPKNANEYFQFELAKEATDDFTGILSRRINSLRPYHQSNQPLYVSFDATEQIKSDQILQTKHWRLPQLRPIDTLTKMQVSHIQGQNNFWFCGTDFSLTGHESAFVSGLVIAQRLGAKYPFKHNWLANAQFNIIKNFMGVHSLSSKAKARLMRPIVNLASQCKLHKKLSHHFINDLLF